VILFFLFLAWTSTFAPPRTMWLVLAGLLWMFLLVLGMVGIFFGHDRSPSKH